MRPLTILIVEDKAIIAEGLETTLAAAGYTVSGKTATGEEAIALVEKSNPDIIVMDIQLAGKMDGIETVERINRSHSIPIIYLTDFHDEKTIERAKHTQPAAYLLKPFKANDLLIAIEIAFYNASNGKKANPGKDEKPSEAFFPFNDRVFIKEKDILIRINISDILWIEASGSYCEIRTKQKKYTLSISLRAFTERLNNSMLLRVHRSFVVNTDKVTAIKGNQLIIGEADNTEIPTSDSYREAVQKRFPVI